MLINLSNHPIDNWDKKQKNIALEKYGAVLDMPFPPVDPEATESNIQELAKEYFGRVTVVFDECANESKPNAVHIQGEFTFVYAVVSMLLHSGIKCIASTTRRTVDQERNGLKTSVFEFVKFREYRTVVNG